MIRTASSLLAGIAATLMAIGTFQETTPPGHPPIPPAGHPEVGRPGADLPADHPPADPQDVSSIDAILGSYYEVISGDAGAERDWDRFRSLFLPNARFTTMRAAGAGASAMVISADEYITINDRYFTAGGYFEREIFRRSDAFGRIAQVFSTYASRRKAEDPDPYSRGINSFQLVFDGSRWWIASMTWDRERPGENPLPARYLPPATAP